MVRFLFYSFSLYISLLSTHSGFLVRKQAITVKSGEFELSLLRSYQGSIIFQLLLLRESSIVQSLTFSILSSFVFRKINNSRETDPFGRSTANKTVLGGLGGNYESMAYDNRQKWKPRFFITNGEFSGSDREETVVKFRSIIYLTPLYLIFISSICSDVFPR